MRDETVRSYSERGAAAYEDPMNKNFLYGDLTVRFLKQIEFAADDKVVLDIGCGTGFVFDELQQAFTNRGMHGIGVEPAVGMLQIAMDKYAGDEKFSFHEGSFERLPVDAASVDRIISTLALHWVKDLGVAAGEMRRVLRDGGGMDIFMIAKDDGAKFKKAIVEALKKHLSFAQIMKTATLVQRVTAQQLRATFRLYFEGFDVEVEEHRDIVYGSFDDHMKWWHARSAPVIAEVEDKNRFMVDLREELEKTGAKKGIPFDTAYHWLTVRGK